MPRNGFRFTVPALLALSLITGPGGALAQDPECTAPLPAPYLFVLFDTSTAGNWSPPCTAAQISDGSCNFLCPTGDCFVPLQADDPASKLYQMKEALYNALRNNTFPVQHGFASFQQDTVRVRSKHWLYTASNSGGVIPGWGPFPAAGSQEVFGRVWKCNNGAGDLETGCRAGAPADLADAWELGRVKRRAKGGSTFEKIVKVFVRHNGVVYRVQYEPAGTGRPGDPTLSTRVQTDRCTNASCSTSLPVSTFDVQWQLVSPFLSWDAAGLTPNRANPQLSYFAAEAAADFTATNTCSGWEPNEDDGLDAYNGYSVLQPAGSTDPRGAVFSKGDVIPLDWQDDHLDDILARLAPNVILDPTAAPDFRVASYFRDRQRVGEDSLRLSSELARPLLPISSSPLGASIQSFRTWFTNWKSVAAAQDPDFACRRIFLLALTANGIDTCGATPHPCSGVAALFSQQRIKTFAVGYGQQANSAGNVITCMANNGGTGAPFFPQNPPELAQALDEVLRGVVEVFGPIEE